MEVWAARAGADIKGPETKILSRLILPMAGISLLLCLTGCNGGDGGAQAPSDATSTALPVTQARPRRERIPALPSPTPTASATTPPFTQSIFLKKNLAFDAMRTRAIESVYAGNTLQALAIVKAARKLRPHDPSIVYWLQAVESGQVPDRAPTHGHLIAPVLPQPSLKPKDKAFLLPPPSFAPTVLSVASDATVPATPVHRAAPRPPVLPSRRPVVYPSINPNLLN